jgi:hypothetical protein
MAGDAEIEFEELPSPVKRVGVVTEINELSPAFLGEDCPRGTHHRHGEEPHVLGCRDDGSIPLDEAHG